MNIYYGYDTCNISSIMLRNMFTTALYSNYCIVHNYFIVYFCYMLTK